MGQILKYSLIFFLLNAISDFHCKDRITKLRIWNGIIKNSFICYLLKIKHKIFLAKTERMITKENILHNNF